jgi:enoyl-CoA hydratase
MDTIRYAARENVAEITIDDGKLNVMTLGFFNDLTAALARAETERVRAVVIAGRPGAYSAGLNLKVIPNLPPAEFNETMMAFARTMLRVFTFPIPTVAAVTGHAIAGGALLAFGCDLRHAAEGQSKLQLNETAIGLTLPSWAIAIGHSAIPQRWHTEAILHARAYSPREALERGMVDAVAPAERLGEQAWAAAKGLTALHPEAYAGSKARHRAAAVQWATEHL